VGIASSDGERLYCEGGAGRVRDQFPDFVPEGELPRIYRVPGSQSIGHVRYSTVQKDKQPTFQPIQGTYCGQDFYLAHNGNLTNKEDLKRLLPEGLVTTNLDTEVIVRLIQLGPTGDIGKDLAEVLRKLEGSFELLLLFRGEIIAVRDPTGTHPLRIGRRSDRSYVIASETSVFARLDATHHSHVEPGTIVRIPLGEAPRVTRYAEARMRICPFEPVYFMGATSDMDTLPDQSVMTTRFYMGRECARECPPPDDADAVLGVPDSGIFYAAGYSAGCKEFHGLDIPHFQAVIRHHDGARAFILPGQNRREAEVRQKLQWSPLDIRNKSWVVLDDSKVRGTTSRYFNGRMRAAGARAVHERMIWPPYKRSCKYGIDTPETDDLLASRLSVEEMRMHVGADSLMFMQLETILKLTGIPPEQACTACVTGEYWHKAA
jgi:amidophosphoribosyltransferase